MKVLLTGGGGFLGAWIIKRLLNKGISVRVFDASDSRRFLDAIVGSDGKRVEWLVGDIVNTEQVISAAEGCDTILHLAGVQTPFCMEYPIQGARINVLGTLNVFEAAKLHGIKRVVYTSSGGVFGLVDDVVPEPNTHYGAFKLANEGSARAYWYENGISSIGMRPFVLYGPGRDAGLTATITQACRAVAKSERFTIKLVGTVPLVYVEDVAAAYEAAVEVDYSGVHVLNLSGIPVTIEHIIEVIRRIVPDAQIVSDGPSLPSISTVKNQHENELLRLPPETTLEEGLLRTIDFYRTNP
ncbi:NAD(P)-dependent oxidoreductase (plasmid) [Agrobacterium leguminum]|uniref:Nucleoside-diphosphate-sugar epimerase n=1 Tax=Agrobacterium deltaense NCPPB 1641 TaxID=1183425 RepID=A0A1S7UAU9_9HYPH|nr:MULTISPECIES: NAD(P)-dependent oxidoreductase [Agrobacterium]WFS69720.1 NAD(P)-dependent oxidoreductase [Agrobacterium leguminum]CVI64014.1 Nucleoside-diphosphate-sugar epimerase [Agrobacterium deltaense NCPPB 1641]